MITITSKALTELVKISRLNKVKQILMSVQGGGCNGFKYNISTEFKKNKLDEVINIHSDLDLVIDHHSIFYIIGSTDANNPKSININKIHKWNNGNDKIYLEFIPEIKKYIELSDIIVLPSYREGMPKILLEASSVGRAIITTDVPGCNQCVFNKLNGILVKAKSSNSLYKAMKYMIENKNLLNGMGQQSRLIAEKKYSIDAVVNKHLEIYEL